MPMWHKSLTLAIHLCLLSSLSLAQESPIDSLRSLLSRDISNEKRAVVLDEMCFRFLISSQADSVVKYQPALVKSLTPANSRGVALSELYLAQGFISTDSSEFFKQSNKALQLADDIRCSECRALVFLSNGLAHRKWQQFSLAVGNLKQGIEAIKGSQGKRSKEITAALNANLSNTYHQLGEFSSALQYALVALRIAESLNDVALMNSVYTPLSTIYADLSSPNNKLGTEQDRARYQQLARHYMMRSYESSLKLNNERTSGTSAYNLGIFYNDENQLDSSSYFLRKAISHAIRSNFPELLSSACNIMAINYSEVNIDSALRFSDRAITYARNAGLVRHEASAMLSKANLLQMAGKSREALQHAEVALKLCLQSERRVSILNAYKILSELYEETGNPAKAYENYRKHIAIKDSLVNEENYASIEELKMKYDVELKDKEINNLSQQSAIQTLQLRQRNVILVSLIIFVILSVIAVWLFVRQRNLRQRQAIMEAEQRLNRARMNPHFFFNALSSLQHQAVKSNDGLALATKLSKFSDVMRKTLESTYQEYITVEHEISYLQQYLSIQKDRSEFEFSLTVSSGMETSELLIPPMIIQPFVENSIEHGFGDRKDKGVISIRFDELPDELYIEITDNGRGLDAQHDGSRHISRATEIIKDRIYLLGVKMKSNARYNVAANPNGVGVLVAIYLPKILVPDPQLKS
jgi:tetratricopeptide (TPR) repeat protein/two-component sensor histidine kinase